jgi:small subunit ribosomal protein S17
MAKAKEKTVQSTPAKSADSAPRKMRNEVVGVVVSDKMNKTISVQVYALVRHARYGKFIRQSSVFKAHDEKNEAKAGDKVRIFETRPYSKTKRWNLVEIVEKKKQVEGVEV